jgi:hypothetical protein
MVNTAGLKAIGWIFGGTTAIVMLVAALLVGDAIAENAGAATSNVISITEAP